MVILLTDLKGLISAAIHKAVICSDFRWTHIETRVIWVLELGHKSSSSEGGLNKQISTISLLFFLWYVYKHATQKKETKKKK